MQTGEGKTLVITLAAYLNALIGDGVHVVTANDYLAQRDCENMGHIYRFLGLSVGSIASGMPDELRLKAYASDITYGANNEFGFDYLRDNMKYDFAHMVQRGCQYAILDEVDSILIDGARTPLIITGAHEDVSMLYNRVDELIPLLTQNDYEVDEKKRSVHLTDAGNDHIEDLLEARGLLNNKTLYEAANVTLIHHVNQSLRAHKLFFKDRDYIVRDNCVIIIDPFTGRLMNGRRYAGGLHQAIEAKEGVMVQPESATLASISLQNYYRLYKKLSGITATAETEAQEFSQTYNLDVVKIPPNSSSRRVDEDDVVYKSEGEKFEAIAAEIGVAHARMQPVLIGTTSIEKSEKLAEFLITKGYTKVDFTDDSVLAVFYEAARASRPAGIFVVLNANFHSAEARIIAQAGVPGAITIATNMAGRGTDIKLGGDVDMRLAHECHGFEGLSLVAKEAEILEEVACFKDRALAAGGLFIIGSERHESRRIDRQLRGRAGRQGDPGLSKFFLSLEDDLMRIFQSQQFDEMLSSVDFNDGEAISHPWINKAIETAQQKVEIRNYDVRKNLLKFDDVMNEQRRVIFARRLEILLEEDLEYLVNDMRASVVDNLVSRFIPAHSFVESWEVQRLIEETALKLNIYPPILDWVNEEGVAEEEIKQRLIAAANKAYAQRVMKNTAFQSRLMEKQILLHSIDEAWREHLLALDHLRLVIGWRALAKRDPMVEYRSDAFQMFHELMRYWDETVTERLMRAEAYHEAPALASIEASAMELLQPQPVNPASTSDTARNSTETSHFQFEPADSEHAALLDAVGRVVIEPVDWIEARRNEPCPCGSGRKFKHCHGKLDSICDENRYKFTEPVIYWGGI